MAKQKKFVPRGNSVPRVRLGKQIDWRYFSKHLPPNYRKHVEKIKHDQTALREFHSRCVSENLIRA